MSIRKGEKVVNSGINFFDSDSDSEKNFFETPAPTPKDSDVENFSQLVSILVFVLFALIKFSLI